MRLFGFFVDVPQQIGRWRWMSKLAKHCHNLTAMIRTVINDVLNHVRDRVRELLATEIDISQLLG